MIVCICHRVSHHDIARAVREGCDSFDELQAELRVATACGACGDCARDTFTVCRAQCGRALRPAAGDASGAVVPPVLAVSSL